MKANVKGKLIMNKFRILAIILVSTFLVGCSAGAPTSEQMQIDPPADLPYEIIRENGQSYLILKEIVTTEYESSTPSAEDIRCIRFDSIAEMVQDIKTGNFTESELKELSRFNKDEDGRILICDISKLYEAYTPGQFDSQRILWFGENYRFDFLKGSDWHSCIMTNRFSYGSLDACIADIIDCTDKPNFELVSTEQIEDRKATMVTYTSGTNGQIKERKSIYYTIEDIKGEIFVYEEYELLSDTVPKMIVIFGTRNGVNYSVYIEFPQERPSVEYLLGFGFREYVETEVA